MGAELPVRIVADLSGFQRDMAAASATAGRHGKEAGGAIASGLETAHKSARRLGGALRIIDPELGGIVREVGHLAGGLSLAEGAGEGLLLGLGALAVAAVAFGEAWHLASEQEDEANKKARESSKAALEAQLGLVHAHEYATQAIELNDKILVEKAKGHWRDYARSALDAFELIAGIIPGVATATNYYRKKLDELDEEQQSNIETMEGHRDRLIELAGAEEKHTEAVKASKEALKKKAEVLELVAKREEDVADYDDDQRRKKSIDDENARVAAVHSEVRALAELVEAKGTLKEQGEHDAENAKATESAWLDTFRAISDATGSLFENSKAAALATAFVNVALGATKTIAELGFPAAIPALIAEGAAGAATIAKISQQSFAPQYHSGGAIPISAQPGEGILNRHGMARLGPQGLDALNRGGPSGSVIQTTNVVGHLAMDTWTVKSLSRMSSPTRSAIQKIQTGVRPGRRDRTA